MGKMSELDLCVNELRSAAKALNVVADNLSAMFDTEKQSTLSISESQKAISLEQVRAVLAEKSRNGHTAAIRVLLEKHGAVKLSEINPEEYAALLADVEGLGNG